jgi:CheY-like chemotaxis protein
MSSFERCVVLVADDEPTVLKTVCYALTRHGYEVIPATDGPSALQACQEREGPVHLALLDVMMPGMSGPELFECLREFHPKIPVLFMSGYQSAHVAASLPGIEDAHFIAKPFLPRSLVQQVNAILGNDDVCVLLEDEPQATHA